MTYDKQTALEIANTVPDTGNGDRREIAQRLVNYIAANYKVGVPGITPCPMDKQGACEEAKKKRKAPGDEFKQAVAKHGMVLAHAEKLRDCAKNEGFTVTFRETSGYCPNWIERKIPMKPPRIHEKSLSNKTVDDCLTDLATGQPKYTQEEIATLNKFKGLVGAYADPVPPNKIGKIVGLRAFDGGIIRLADLCKLTTDEIPPGLGQPITGDYDAHDLIDKVGNRVKPNSDEEKEMRLLMNLDVTGIGNDEETNVIQHGPQSSYLDHVMANPEKVMAPQFQPDLPVLAFDKNGDTFLFEKGDEAALAAFYRCVCNPDQEIPQSWNLSKEQCEELTGIWNESALKGAGNH